jgi:uncharacterized phage-associated protein
MFNEQKAAQIAAWFIASEGGSMPHLKLIKLMYLAERASLQAHGYLMTGDRFSAMPHGPVLSLTLDHINDGVRSGQDGWDSWVSDKANHTVGLVREVSRDALDELSDADINVIEATWKKFGWMSKFQIRDYTHDPKNCPEWQDPDGSSMPIEYETVFKALGFPDEAAKEMEHRIREQSRVDRALGQ